MKFYLLSPLLFLAFLSLRPVSARTVFIDSLDASQGKRTYPVWEGCPAPQNFVAAYGTSTMIQWFWQQLASGEARYRVRWRQSDTSVWNETEPTANPFIDVYNLTNATTYEAQVQSICNGQPGAYSASIFATTSCPIPDGGYYYDVRRTSAYITWGSPGDGTTYDIQWRTAGITTWPNSVTVSGTSYTFQNLSPETTYEYRLRTLCRDGNTSDYLPVRSFTTTNCVEPVGLDAHSSLDNSIFLIWSVQADLLVDLEWRPVGATNWSLVPNLPTDMPTATTSRRGTYRLEGLTKGTTYEWRAQAICDASSRSSFTSSYTFTASCAPPLSAYEAQVNPTSVDLNWYHGYDVSGATYRIQWRPQTSPESGWSTLPDQEGYEATLSNLIPGTAYEWRMQTVCSATSVSPFSVVRIFTTPTTCPPPTGIGPVYVTSTSARIGWNPSASGAQYRLRWRHVNSSVWTEEPPTSNTYYDLTSLQVYQGYICEVQTICDDQAGPYSTESSYIILSCQPPANLTTSNVTATSARLNWQYFDASTAFMIHWREAGTTSWTDSLSITATGTNLLTDLMPGTTYQWRIQTLCTDGNRSEYSGILSFSTSETTPIFTVQTGNWTNPAVWSCNCLPVVTDLVELRHSVTIPDGQTGRARRIQYTSGSKLTIGAGARLTRRP